jgi:tetratricopeptide (TPR) repeat protein
MIDRAVTLNPLSVTTHIAKGLMTLYGHGDTTEAGNELAKALELQPNYYPAVMRLAEVHYFQGETAEAIRLAEQALSLEPQAVWIRHYLVRMYLDVGDSVAARELIDQGPKADTLLSVPYYVYERDWKRASELATQQNDQYYSPLDDGPTIWAYVQNSKATRDFHTARKQLEEWGGLKWRANGEPFIQETNLDYSDSVAIAQMMIWAGEKASAVRVLREVVRMLDHGAKDLKRGEHMFGTARAMTRALLGDREGALQSLREDLNGVNQGTWWYIFEYEPAFDGLRDDPRFAALRHQEETQMAAQRAQVVKLRAAGAVPVRGPVSH